MAVITSTDDDFDDVIEQNKKVVIKYFADWCGSCKLFAPKYKRLSEDDQYNGITFLEVNAEENEFARRKSGVNNLPFFSIFKDGELVEGVATSKEEVVVDLINKLN